MHTHMCVYIYIHTHILITQEKKERQNGDIGRGYSHLLLVEILTTKNFQKEPENIFM